MDASRSAHEPTEPELLDQLAELAEAHYQMLWASSTRAEQIVLAHVAEDRFANSKDRLILRRLIARGLIRRLPRIALMNETFRWFVLARSPALEAVAERERTLSVWDGVKWPILMLIVASLTVVLVTQQEAFNAATAVVMSLATVVPAFARIVGWFGDRRVGT